MKSIIIAIFFGLFLTTVVVGVLSVSPILDTPEADLILTKLVDRVLPRQLPEATPQTTKMAASKSAPKVLGLQTKSDPASISTVYGLINGTRRDQDRSILKVNGMLELAATELNMNRQVANSVQSLDEATIISDTGYRARSFSVLEATGLRSNWEIVENWQKDPRAELLLHADTFNEMGMSILCDAHNEKCTALLVLAATF